MERRRLGIFVSGFRWSGSSAVSDWLYGFDAIDRPVGSESTIGEIRALNYGVQALLLVAEGRILFGERLARWALCPDPRRWQLFGKSLYRSRGIRGHLDRVVDATMLALLKGKLRPRLPFYRSMLDEHLGWDALENPVYMQRVQALVDALQNFVDSDTVSVVDDADVVHAVSRLFELFYERLASDASVPVFDNSIAGMNARYYRLFDRDSFDRRLIYLVERDPRDQFAEQVRHSVRTLPSMVNGFIRDYRANVDSALALTEHFRDEPKTTVRVLSFEEFVCSDALRDTLGDEVRAALADAGYPTGYGSSAFEPERSRKNIGLWQTARLERQMKVVSAELPQWLRREADPC